MANKGKRKHKSQSYLLDLCNREKYNWFSVLLQFRASVIPAIWPRVAFCTAFAVLITALNHFKYSVALPSLSIVVPSIVLGLLLVFRTNTAYERYWEGRKLWGMANINIRNFARTLWVVIPEKTPADRQSKKEILWMLLAFMVTTKLHLRNEPIDHGGQLKELLSEEKYLKLHSADSPPLEIAFWIGDFLQEKHEKGYIDSYRLGYMFKSVDVLVEVFSGCERILRTPIPLAYSIHLKQMLMLYCLTLPFQVINDALWWTPLIVSLISFAVFGIEEIGIEIENPFGYDTNDLPLNTFCQNMKKDMDGLMNLEPSLGKKLLKEDRQKFDPKNWN